MSCKLRENPVFQAEVVRFLKNRPLARQDIDKALASLCENPQQGDRYPALFPNLYKARWPLKTYKTGRSGGLRFVYVLQEAEQQLLPITFWLKKDYTHESDAIAHVKQRYKDTINALKVLKAATPP